MDISKLAAGQEVYAINHSAFSRVYAKKGKVVKVGPWGVKVQTADEMLRFDINDKGRGCNVLDDMPFWERTVMFEAAVRAEEARKIDKTTVHSASEHAGDILLETFGVQSLVPQDIFDQVTAEHPDWTIGNRVEEAQRRVLENESPIRLYLLFRRLIVFLRFMRAGHYIPFKHICALCGVYHGRSACLRRDGKAA